MAIETVETVKKEDQNRYKAEGGSVIDTQTGMFWHSGWHQWEAEAIAEALNKRDFSRLILRGGTYVEGVKQGEQ